MDERVRQGYCKIHSELFSAILFLAAGSVIVNVLWFHKGFEQLWFEYIILVGSPIYRLIRLRMLEISDLPETGRKKRSGIMLLFGGAGAVLVFLLMEYIRFGRINVRTTIVFLVPFIILFCLTAYGVELLKKRWKRKLDRKYEEE